MSQTQKRRRVKIEVQPNAEASLALLRRQDAAAFTELVRGNERFVVGLCKAMGLRGADVEDAAAKAFAEVYQSLPLYEGRSALSTWVYRIASRVIWRVRADRNKRCHADLNEATMAAESASTADRVQTRDRSRRLWAAVAKLEDRQATAVELYYRRDCSVDEIADRLNCPAGTVKTLLFRARAALREMLHGELEP